MTMTRIDRELDALLVELRDLPTVVQEWDDLPESVRASVSLDRDHLLLDVLRDLQQRKQRSELDDQQLRRLHEAHDLLCDEAQSLKRLGFPVPASVQPR